MILFILISIMIITITTNNDESMMMMTMIDQELARFNQVTEHKLFGYWNITIGTQDQRKWIAGRAHPE